MASEPIISSSPSTSTDDAHKALAELRLSVDESKPEANGITVNGINGKSSRDSSPRHSGEASGVLSIESLQKELNRTREEKESLQTQYQNLVSRLNSMRTTLGNKLKQDAVRT